MDCSPRLHGVDWLSAIDTKSDVRDNGARAAKRNTLSQVCTLLKNMFQRQLEEASIRSIVLEELRSCDTRTLQTRVRTRRHMLIQKQTVSGTDTLTLPLATRGVCAIRFVASRGQAQR